MPPLIYYMMFTLKSTIVQQKDGRSFFLVDTTGMEDLNNTTGFGIINGVEINNIRQQGAGEPYFTLKLSLNVRTSTRQYASNELDLFDIFAERDSYGQPTPWVNSEQLQFELTPALMFSNGDGGPDSFEDGLYDITYVLYDHMGEIVSVDTYTAQALNRVTTLVYSRLANIPITAFSCPDYRRPDTQDTLFVYTLLKSLEIIDINSKSIEMLRGLRTLEKYLLTPCFKSPFNECSSSPRF